MKGDFSRWRTGAAKNFNGVLPQQGKVLLDRDGIAQTMLANDWQQKAARDIVGACAAVPQTEPNSFLVTNAALPAGGAVTLTVDTGRVWADGLLVRLHGAAGATSVTRTATWLEPPIVPNEGSAGDVAAGIMDTVVLEVWQRAANGFALPDDLIEPALGGPDTAERLQTEFAFRLARLAAGQTCSELTYDESSRGTLNVSLVPPVTTTGDCPLNATGGYSGFEHQLYHIEVADTSAAFAEFKWSRINAGLVGRGAFDPGTQTVTIDANAAAVNSYNQTAFYLEIEEEDPNVGYTRVIAGANATLNAGVLQLDAAPHFGVYPAAGDVFFRLWDGISAVSAFPIVSGATLPTLLESGIQLQFSAEPAATYIPGDYWIFPVRAQGIANPAVLIDSKLPQGIRYHRVPLAEITWASDGAGGFQSQTIQDCRKPIHPVTESQCCCTYRVGDGIDSFGDFTKIQDAVNALPATGGEICILAGRYFENVLISRCQDVVIHGCGWQTRVASASLGPNGANATPPWAGPKQKSSGIAAVFTVAASAHVQFRSFCIEAADSEAGILLDGVDEVTPSQQPGGKANSGARTYGAIDTIIEDLVITAGAAPAILAMRVSQLVTRRNRIVMANEKSIWPAAFFSGNQIFIEENLVTIQSSGTVGGFLPATVATDLSLNSVDFPTETLHPGGIQIGGNSTLVFITDNEIVSGSRNGITLGSLIVVDSSETDTGTWQGVVFGSGDNCCTGGLGISGSAPGTGTSYANAGTLTEIVIERNLIGQMGLCGIGPVAFFDLAKDYEIISILDLSIVGNTIVETVQRALDTSSALGISSAGTGAITLADVAYLTIRDNTITDFGQSPGVQVSGIFVMFAQGIEVSRNQIAETRDWTAVPNQNANPGTPAAGIAIALATSPESSGETLLAGDPTYEPGVSAVRISENTVRVARGQGLALVCLGPTSIVNNHFGTGGLITNSALQLAQTVLVVNLGTGIDWSNLGASNPSDVAGMAQVNAGGALASGSPSFAGVTNGTLLFSNNICQLEARASAAVEICSVFIVTPDSLIFSNNATWLDAATFSAFTDVFLVAGTVQAIGNRLQEAAGSVAVSGVTIGAANITSQNISTACLLAKGALSMTTGNLVLYDFFQENICSQYLSKLAVPGT